MNNNSSNSSSDEVDRQAPAMTAETRLGLASQLPLTAGLSKNQQLTDELLPAVSSSAKDQLGNSVQKAGYNDRQAAAGRHEAVAGRHETAPQSHEAAAGSHEAAAGQHDAAAGRPDRHELSAAEGLSMSRNSKVWNEPTYPIGQVGYRCVHDWLIV